MIRTQQSEDQNEGFFKPIIKIIKPKQQNPLNHNELKINSQANNLVEKSLPSDYQAKIMSLFQSFNYYPDKLISDKCTEQREQLKSLLESKQKITKKYFTLQQKYQNNLNYRLIYSKISKQRQFGSYIFSLDNYSEYHKANFITADSSNSTDNIKKQQFSLKFDSNFQSGNLLYVFENVQQTNDIPTFDLIIQNDTNTKGYNQWFYFCIENYDLMKNKTVKINIVNFIKKHLMFEDGVRPVAFFQDQNQWKFIGRQLEYKKSYLKRYIESNGSIIPKNYYTLSFLLDFPRANQQNQLKKVYIALNYPYPYKRMMNFIDKLIKENKNLFSIKKQTLCYSISHNQVPLLKITSVLSQNQIKKFKQSKIDKIDKKKINQDIDQDIQLSSEQIQDEIQKKKKKIIIFGRQHPGETVGSFVLENFLNKLILQGSESNTNLLKEYSIYVFPMINVDGVIYGNFRTNLAGFDLNRQWISPNRWLTPEIYYLKKYISNLTNIQFVLDFHGHSRQLNSFIYACCNPVPILVEDQDKKNFSDMSMFRLFPYVLSKEQELFSIKNCTFSISKDKVKTARINMFKFLNYNPFIFTFQTSFYGYTKQNKAFRYKIQDFVKIGNGALQSLKIVLLKPKRVKQIIKQIKNKDYLFDKWQFENKQDPGSESNPSEDELNPTEIKNKVFSDKKMNENEKILKSIEKRKKQQKIKNKIRERKTKKTKKIQNSSQFMKLIDKSQSKKIKQPEGPINLKLNFTSKKKDRFKPLLTESLQKKKSQQFHNLIVIRQAKIKKPPENTIEQSNTSQYFIQTKKKTKIQQFKSSSNLLGTGISYFHQSQSPNFVTQNLKQSTPSPIGNLQIKNLNRQDRFQSFSSAFQYDGSVNKNRRLNQTSFIEQPQSSKFIDLKQKSTKIMQSKKSHRDKLFIVRENKIVKAVESVSKKKNLLNHSFLQNQLSQRRQTLRQCQQIMSLDNKCLLNEIKQQENDEKRRKKIFLNPLIQ